jgi:uncharacterized protein YeaO (DUF488 family)
MTLRTFRIGDPKGKSASLRIAAARYLPRGVRKTDYARLGLFDVWLPGVAPSRELIRWLKSREWSARTARTFFTRYTREMRASTDARQTIKLLAAMSKRTPIAIGWYCEDERRCHRSALARLIRRAAQL